MKTRYRVRGRKHTTLELRLIADVEKLEQQVKELGIYNTIKLGKKAEDLLADTLGGKLTRYNDSFDLTTINGKTIEIKSASRTVIDRKRASQSYRWTWGALTGSGGNKQCDAIILMGANHIEEEEPYTYFYIPRDRLKELGIIPNKQNQRRFSMACNFARHHKGKSAKHCVDNFLVTLDELILLTTT